MDGHAAVGAGGDGVLEGRDLRHRDDALLPEDGRNAGRVGRALHDAVGSSRHRRRIVDRAGCILQGHDAVVCARSLQLLRRGTDGGVIGQGGHIHLGPAAAGDGFAVQLRLCGLRGRLRGSCLGRSRRCRCFRRRRAGGGFRFQIAVLHHSVPGVGGPVQHMGCCQPGRAQHRQHQHHDAHAPLDAGGAAVEAAVVTLDLRPAFVSCHSAFSFPADVTGSPNVR